ncbi:histidinol-phosphate transaminase [bacterium]|nr:histidinol-phosphate transaminase [bacterium]
MKQKYNPDPVLVVREHLRSLVPCRPARSGRHERGSILLDANENAFGTPGGLCYNRYPDPSADELRTAIAGMLGLDASAVIAGNGSDEIIDLLFRACCEPGKDEAAVITPSYGMYGILAAIHGAGTVEIPLDRRFDLDLDRTLDLLARRTRLKLLFLCSPNNPTGNLLSADAVTALAAAFQGITVVDEAYIDFASGPGLLGALGAHSRLFLIRTLSKAWGLAGIRVGFGIGDPRLVRILNRIRLPYNLGTPAQTAALHAMHHADDKERMIGAIIAERNRLAAALQRSASVRHVYPSDANFILIRTGDADALHAYLRGRGIVVRNRSRLPGCGNCLRISVGTPAENDALLRCLNDWEDLP